MLDQVGNQNVGFLMTRFISFLITERSEISRKEFEAAKASGAIVGCDVPAYKESIPDESDLVD